MALESTGKEGGREGREKSLATIEMESCYLREGGGICRIETFARHRLSGNQILGGVEADRGRRKEMEGG